MRGGDGGGRHDHWRAGGDGPRRGGAAVGLPPLVGRDDLLELARRALDDPSRRCLTLTGRAGSGRTRLAREIARLVPVRWLHVDASGADDLELARRVAAALDLDSPLGDACVERVLGALCAEPTVLLADDVGGRPDVLAELLSSCDRLRVIATALSPIGVPGECVLPVDGLAVPRPGASFEEVGRSPAVQLFCERATATTAHFRLDEGNAAEVAELCRRLDGSPLAIDLAAARSRLLPPAALLAEFDRRSTLGTLGPALRRSLDASCALLTAGARSALRHLGVLQGPATIEAVRALAGLTSYGEAVGVLAELVDLHLVQPHSTAEGEGRFALGPLVREHALDELVAAGELDEAQRRHARHYAASAREAAARTLGPERRAALERLELEHDDLVHAASTLARLGEHDAALRLELDTAPLAQVLEPAEPVAGRVRSLLRQPGLGDATRAEALCWLAALLGRFGLQAERGEARGLLCAGLELATTLDDAVDRARVLLVACHALGSVDDVALVRTAAERGRHLAASVGDRWLWCRYSSFLAAALHQGGDGRAAALVADEAYATARALGDDFLRLRLALVLHGIRPEERPPGSAPPPLTELLEMAETVGDGHGRSALLVALGAGALARGRVAESAAWVGALVRLAATSGSPVVVGIAMMQLALLAAAAGDARAAARFHGAGAHMQPFAATSLPPHAVAEFHRAMDRVRAELGPVEFERAAEVTASWPALLTDAAEQAARLAEETVRITVGPVTLTVREADVLRLLSEGCTNKEIAQRLELRPKTVMHYNEAIYRKLGVRRRAGAVSAAIELGLIEPPARR